MLDSSGAFVVDPPEGTLSEVGKARFLGEYGKSTCGQRLGMHSEVRQEDATIVWHASVVDESRGLDFEDVVRHLPGGDASLGGVGAGHGILPEGEAQGRCQDPCNPNCTRSAFAGQQGSERFLRRSSAASDFGVNTVLLAVKFGGELPPTR